MFSRALWAAILVALTNGAAFGQDALAANANGRVDASYKALGRDHDEILDRVETAVGNDRSVLLLLALSEGLAHEQLGGIGNLLALTIGLTCEDDRRTAHVFISRMIKTFEP